MRSQHILHYLQPAHDWHEALPLGNGYIGAMVFGGVEREHIQLNEDSLWNGGYVDRNNPDCLEHFPKIRRLLSEGKIREAELLMKRTVAGIPDNMRSYQTLGRVILEMGTAMSLAQASPLYPDTGKPFPNDYQRQLDLETATASVRYTYDKVGYCRKSFVSAPAGVLIIHLSADKPGKLTFHVKIERGQLYDHAGRFFDNTFRTGGDTIGYDGISGGDKGIGFCCMMKAASIGGRVQVLGEYICVEDADEAVLYLSAATTYRYADPKHECEKRLRAAAKKDYSELYQEHLSDYQALYGRCGLELEGNAEREDLPTDLRLSAYRAAGGNDPGLEALLFHYGRYLLISSSRLGTLPANLQGIWCYEYAPKWDSKFTININTQMNYWAVEKCNLSELHLPFFTLMERMYPNGVKTAEKMYGCRGWMAHHNTDLWGDTAPQDSFPSSTYWIMGAAWMATHIWTHYIYNLDTAFLKKYYPLMRDACIFLLDFMLEDDKGRLIVSPTSSPENTYRLPNGELGELCMGCTMDSQIVRRLFEDTISAAKIVETDEEFVKTLQAALNKLPLTQIGPDGRIMEWLEPYEEPEPGHRHISQLYGLYPGEQISPFTTPDLAEAARKTIETRLKNGGGHTGWSRVWLILFWARLLNGDKAGENLMALLQKSTHPNLFGFHPPFQIDSNLGVSAAVAEMLVQTHLRKVVLLPALPSSWHTGSIRGLRLPCCITLDIAWRNGKLTQAVLLSMNNTDLTLWYGDKEIVITLPAGQRKIIDSFGD